MIRPNPCQRSTTGLMENQSLIRKFSQRICMRVCVCVRLCKCVCVCEFEVQPQRRVTTLTSWNNKKKEKKAVQQRHLQPMRSPRDEDGCHPHPSSLILLSLSLLPPPLLPRCECHDSFMCCGLFFLFSAVRNHCCPLPLPAPQAT